MTSSSRDYIHKDLMSKGGHMHRYHFKHLSWGTQCTPKSIYLPCSKDQSDSKGDEDKGLAGSQSGWGAPNTGAGATSLPTTLQGRSCGPHVVTHGKTCGGPQGLEVGELRPALILQKPRGALPP